MGVPDSEETPNVGNLTLRKYPIKARTVPTRHPIALVDDDPTVRRALQRILSTMDYAVSPFASAEEFLAAEQVGQFRCLLLDIQLRGLSGLELYAQLTAEHRLIPVVFISASADGLRAARAAAGEDSEVMLKPLDAESLKAAIDRSIGNGHVD